MFRTYDVMVTSATAGGLRIPAIQDAILLASDHGPLRLLPTRMQDLGVTQCWLPPPSQSVSRQGYLPGQLYDFNTHYGSEAQLRKLLDDLRDAEIAPLADIVINHRCADQQDQNGCWNIFTCAQPPDALTAACTQQSAWQAPQRWLSADSALAPTKPQRPQLPPAMGGWLAL